MGIIRNVNGRTNRFLPDELLEKARDYFDLCDKTILSEDPKTGAKIKKPKTISGFCMSIGVTKDYFNDKMANPKYVEALSFIKQEVENNLEENILTGANNASSGIFLLKNNFGYKDKIETENKTDTEITITFKE